MLDDAFGHWLAGFVDGEGCFLISQQPTGNYQCSFRLRVRADEISILREIHEGSGLGHLRYVRRSPDTPRQNPCFDWRLTSKRDCAALVVLLDRYPLRAKKARDFAIWREAVREWGRCSSQGRRRSDWSHMASLAEALRTGREYDEPFSEMPSDPLEQQHLWVVPDEAAS